jgi:hypothetical protein
MRRLVLTLIASVLTAGFTPALAAETATASVSVTATFTTRTSLEVSTQTLHFDADGRGHPATASVDFAAKARTGATSEVVLCVEPLRAADGLAGITNVEAAVTFEGQGEGMLGGRIAAARPVMVGRWIGSGRRHGRVVFVLRAAAAGTYVLPVRFILSAP